MLSWRVADTQPLQEEGVRFLCRHADKLGVPYNWSTIVHSLYAAIRDDGLLLAMDGDGNMRGAIACALGTGEDNYADRGRMEVHLLYLDERARSGREPVGAIAALVERELEWPRPLEAIGFYAAPEERLRKLFGKLADLDHTREHRCGPLDFYWTTPARLRAFVGRAK
ncbi:hypothetical protein [Cohnella sp. 56]|uniref:hypothetical protein n=1 Tax=Cohnella sp. 56 TaxID=3113722 RepID=UPI0030E76DEF